MRHVARFLFLIPLLVGFSSPASATGGGETWQAKVKAAKKACATGDPEKGVDILGDLFVESNDITHVFNQGRCYQQNQRWTDAIGRFEEYLRKSPNLSPAERAEVDAHLADCKSRLPPAPTTAGAQAGPAIATTLPSEVPPAARPGGGMRAAGVAIAAVGLAAVATGAVLALKTHSITDDVHKNGYDPDKLSSRDSYETGGWVSFGVGAAGIVAGAALYLVGATSKSSSVALVPLVGQGGAILQVRGGAL